MRNRDFSRPFAIFLFFALSVVLACSFVPVKAQAQTSFPKYEMTFQRLVGSIKDGKCVIPDNPEVTYLRTFAFHATLFPCDGLRTTVRFRSSGNSHLYPTNQFRFGATWQYYKRGEGPKNYHWTPFQTFLYDGKPAEEKLPSFNRNSIESMVVHKNGVPQRIGGREDDFWEPFHHVFEDTFADGEEHTFQFDAWVPIDAVQAGLSWGTGSTGDGNPAIGATANGLYIDYNKYPMAGADFRFVKDADYREFVKDPVAKDKPLPGRNDDLKLKLPDENSTFETIRCLEDRQLAPFRDRITTKEIYPELPYSTEIPFREEYVELGMAAWPYQVSQTGRVPGNFDHFTWLRPFNYVGPSDKYVHRHGFRSYEEEIDQRDGTPWKGRANFPFRPSVESIARTIPGYAYRDNNLPIIDAKYGPAVDLENPSLPGSLTNYIAGKNFWYDIHSSGLDTQHFYYTYEPSLTSFKLIKSDAVTKKQLPEAQFQLYKEPDMKEYLPEKDGGYACKKKDLPKLLDLKVCQDDSDPKTCTTKKVISVAVPGGNEDGTFTTGADGTFTPNTAKWMEAGTYYAQELKTPAGYYAKSSVTEFKVSPEDATEAQIPAVKVSNFPKTSVTVEKKWLSAEGTPLQALDLSRTIELQLMAGETPVGKPVTVKADSEGKWIHTFTDLPPVDAANKPIVYTVKETPVAGFTTTIGKTEVHENEQKLTVSNSELPPPTTPPTTPPSTPPVPPPTTPPNPPLTRTGSQVTGAIALGALLVASGVLLLSRRTKRSQ